MPPWASRILLSSWFIIPPHRTSWPPFVLSHCGCCKNFIRFASNFLCKVNPSLRLSSLAIAVFCDQHHPKARLPSHHLRVRRRGLFEWDGLDHGGHAGQGTESERGITGRRVPRQGTFNLAASKYEIRIRKLDRLRADAEVDRDSTRTK